VKPTVHDIAREAGVSLATVDRVLNARPGVREKTVARVQDAIRSLGYVRDLTAANLARQRLYRFTFVLPEPTTSFLSALHAEVGTLAARARIDRVEVRVVSVPAFDPHAVASALHRLDDQDGVAIMAPDTPEVRDAARWLKTAGAIVVALVSDLSEAGQDHFAGINNMAAGRTAGLLIGRFLGRRSGSVAVIAGSMIARDHVERRKGFDDVMQAEFPGLRVLPSLEARDDADTVARLVARMIDTTPDLCGIYSLGAGNRGLVRVLSDRGLAGQVTVVGHELTPLHRAALLDRTIDAVINQDVGHLVRSALRVLRAKADGTEIIAAQERIRIDIFLRENLV
jgi:LacI family transcriptional regulator